MPNPKLETYKNKATGTVYDYTDAAAQAALAGILDGTDINNFSDVESALATKVDKVTGKGLSTNDYDNTAKGIVDNIQSNIIANTKLIKDTVGWSGKNKFDLNKYNSKTGGITYSITGNSLRVQSTALTNQNIVFDIGLPKNTDMKLRCDTTYTSGKGLIVILSSDDGVNFDNLKVGTEFNTSGTQNIAFNTGNHNYYQVRFFVTRSTAEVGDITFSNIMVYDADILDDTYEPYFGSTAFPRSEQAVLGAYNILPTGNVSHNDHGIVVSTDSVGIVTVTGTLASDAPVIYKVYISNYKLPVGRYKMVGCPPNGANNLQNQLLEVKNGSTVVNSYTDIGEGVEFEITDASYTISVYVPRLGNGLRGEACNFVYKPMITIDLNATYADFVPHAMTNRELTDNVASRVIFKTLSGGDLDDILTTGWYSWGGTAPTHSPQGVAYSCMQCIVETGVQKQIVYFGADVIYMRQRSGSPATWGSWYKFQGTIVS